MGFAVTLGIALVLAMDAFAVSVCMGIDLGEFKLRHALTLGACFGAFQFIMPVIGFYLGISIHGTIEKYDHWIAFFLLAFVGVKMFMEAFEKEKRKSQTTMNIKTMLTLSVATSIDAFIIGVTFALTGAELWLQATVIGVVTFMLSAIGGFIGRRIGFFFGKWANMAGGAVLIAIGVKTLFEHLA